MQQSSEVIIDGRESNDYEFDTPRSDESEEIMAEKNKNLSISKIASSVLGSIKSLRALGSMKSYSVSGGKMLGIASAFLIMSSPAYSLGLGVLDVESNLARKNLQRWALITLSILIKLVYWFDETVAPPH